jgi:hypothetical protein
MSYVQRSVIAAMEPKPPNKNVETTHTESESKASETSTREVVLEHPKKTKEDAAKAVKEQHGNTD